MQIRIFFVLFVLAACCYLLVCYRRRLSNTLSQKEAFAADIDEVMDNYCKETQVGKDDYKGPWDNIDTPKCVTSECPMERCWTLTETDFGTNAYRWRESTAPQIRSSEGGCVSKSNESNIRCGDEPPDTGGCDVNGFDTYRNSNCCEWNRDSNEYICHNYNHILNEKGECEFRRVYGTETMDAKNCKVAPSCFGSVPCPNGTPLYNTFDSNGDCIEYTVSNCEKCDKEELSCDTFDSDRRAWTNTLYSREFGLNDNNEQECAYWKVNVNRTRVLPSTKLNIGSNDCRDDKSNIELSNKNCKTLTLSRFDDIYFYSNVSYQGIYDSNGTAQVWTSPGSSDEYEESYFDQSNSDCYPSCPTGTQKKIGFLSEVCAPCPENHYYMEGSNCIRLSGCSNYTQKMTLSYRSNEDSIRYIASNNTCDSCKANGYAGKYATECEYCSEGSSYYDPDRNSSNCSECEGDDKYIEANNDKVRECKSCPSNKDRGSERVYYDTSLSTCHTQCKDTHYGGGAYHSNAYPECRPKCGVAQYMSNNECVNCPPGQYNRNSNHIDQSCIPCPKGSYESNNVCYSCGLQNGVNAETDQEGSSNRSQCFIPCGNGTSNIYWNDKYDMSQCGKKPCDPIVAQYFESNIAAPRGSSGFKSRERILKTYQKNVFGQSACQEVNERSLNDWTKCEDNLIRADNRVFCCGPDSPNKQINSKGYYCECKQNRLPHSKVYMPNKKKCVIQCADDTSAAPGNSTFKRRDDNTCDFVCNSNYYKNGTRCDPCPDGGYSDGSDRYHLNQGKTTCYKDKTVHSNVCANDKELSSDAPNKLFWFESQTNYNQSYCRYVCPARFEQQDDHNKYKNMKRYVYRDSTTSDSTCSDSERDIELTDIDEYKFYDVNLNNKEAYHMNNGFSDGKRYYTCDNLGEKVKFGNTYGASYAMCCPSNMVPDNSGCKYEITAYRYNYAESKSHGNGVSAYLRTTLKSDVDVNDYAGTNTLPNSVNTAWPIYLKNNINNDLQTVETDLDQLSSEHQYVYRCNSRTDQMNKIEDWKLHCCPEALPYIRKGGVCTVECGEKGITYAGKCYVEAKIQSGSYVLISGNYVGKYTDSYGLGVGNPDQNPEANCTLYLDIYNDTQTNTLRINMYGDGSNEQLTLGLINNMLSTAGIRGQPTLYVSVDSSSHTNEFMIIVSSTGDNFDDATTDLYYSYFINIGGIYYLRFSKFPRYNSGILNTNIPRNKQVAFMSISDFDNYARTYQKACPVDTRSTRTISGVDEPGQNSMTDTTYLWDPSWECKLKCANSDEEVYWNATAGAYDSCPPQRYGEAWNTATSNDIQITCILQPGGTVSDYQEVPSRACAIDGHPKQAEAVSVSPGQKVLCLNGTSWNHQNQQCMRQVNYWIDGSKYTNYSYDGEKNQNTIYAMEVTQKSNVIELIHGLSDIPTGTSSNTEYVCSPNSERVTGSEPPVCCATSNHNAKEHQGNYYCCPSDKTYLSGVGCIPSSCTDGFLIGDSCFKRKCDLDQGYYPVKYKNNGLYLKTDGAVNNQTLSNVILVAEDGKRYFTTSGEITRNDSLGFLKGFYENDSNYVLLFNDYTSDYLINNSGQRIRVPASSMYVDGSNEFYLDLTNSHNCPSFHEQRPLAKENQRWINSSNDECEYECPLNCTSSGSTYIPNDGIESCGFRNDCKEKYIDEDTSLIDFRMKSNIPCGSNDDCCPASQ